ncbi:MAG: flagellar hook-basal body complex protein FliE [Nitrospirae bacterium]|nr:MAG: flagellar hook-basal body complex protein FliE [Nitrospirota bacterium]
MSTDPLKGLIGKGLSTEEINKGGVKPSQVQGEGFDKLLDETIGKVNTLQKEAEAALEALTGGSGDIVQAMVSMQKAELSFQTMVEVRNKLVRAYEDIIRMQV